MDVNSDVVDHWLWLEMVRIEWLVGEESGNKVPDYFLDKGFLHLINPQGGGNGPGGWGAPPPGGGPGAPGRPGGLGEEHQPMGRDYQVSRASAADRGGQWSCGGLCR